MTKLEGASYGPHNDGKPGHMVILLHGYGADGNDLIGLAPVMGPLMPDVVFYAPNAPQPCEGNPFGYQWFPVSRLDPALALAGVRGAAADVDAFLDEKMAEHGLDESKTALVGFSQGTMMALHVGLRRARPLAGIVGFSGMLAGPEVLKDEIKSRPPVLLTHGDKDEMLPHILSHRAAEVLQQHDVKVGLHIAEGIGHGINDTGLSAAARFLIEVVQAADAANERRDLQARLRARRRSLPEELRRQGRGRRLGLPHRRRRDRGRPVGRHGRPEDRRAVDEGHGQHRLLLHQGRDGALRPRAGQPRQARPRRAGRRAVAGVCAETARSARRRA